tara:strand:+ start:38 stop:814 length:777 start_codon:yes stop_codon:yes gene_type:complete
LQNYLFFILAIIFSIPLGSFYNVLIYRLPDHKNIIVPPSACPYCKAFIKWYDNIPIVSFIFLRGKCRKCHQPISIRYLIVELLSPILMVSIFVTSTLLGEIIIYYLFFSALMVIFFIDLKHKIIPNVITYSLMVIGIGLNFLYMNFQSALIFNVLGLGIGAGIILFIMYVYKKIRGIDGMGFGDVKLFAVLGIWFGWQGCLIILFLSSFLGSVFGMMGILNNKFSMQKQLPFAPFIVVASAIYYFNKQLIFNLLLMYF